MAYFPCLGFVYATDIDFGAITYYFDYAGPVLSFLALL